MVGKTPPLAQGSAATSMSNSSSPGANRRSFLKETAAGLIGGCCVLVPAAAGVVAWLDPLAHDAATGSLVNAGRIDALPTDGSPRRVTIIMEKTDAWTRQQAVPIGAVYLRRSGEKVTAFQSVCPHAGCFVDYLPARRGFMCPCHESTFAEDGSINDPHSPSPRGLDALEVEIRGPEVWVRFQSFRTGSHEKVPAT